VIKYHYANVLVQYYLAAVLLSDLYFMRKKTDIGTALNLPGYFITVGGGSQTFQRNVQYMVVV